jgi:hypothetical protein
VVIALLAFKMGAAMMAALAAGVVATANINEEANRIVDTIFMIHSLFPGGSCEPALRQIDGQPARLVGPSRRGDSRQIDRGEQIVT